MGRVKGVVETEKVTHKRDTSEVVDNQFEVLTKLVKIHGREVNPNITSDYPLAHLGEEERTFVKETYENAGFIKFIIDKVKDNSFKYVWDSNQKTWLIEKGQYKRVPLTETESRLMDAYSKYLFDSMMISPDILTILKRNTEQNFMLKLLGNIKEVDNEGNEVMQEQGSTIQRLKEELVKNENK